MYRHQYRIKQKLTGTQVQCRAPVYVSVHREAKYGRIFLFSDTSTAAPEKIN
jgi:hypothetical protein